MTLHPWMLYRAHPHCIIGQATLSAGGKHRAGLVVSICGPHRPTIASRPQPYAVRRLGGAGTHPGRGPRDDPPCADQPAGRRHRREGEPRHRRTAFEPEILPDGQGHQTGRGVARLRDALGLRASIPCFQGVARVADPPDGRGGLNLPTRDTASACAERNGQFRIQSRQAAPPCSLRR